MECNPEIYELESDFSNCFSESTYTDTDGRHMAFLLCEFEDADSSCFSVRHGKGSEGRRRASLPCVFGYGS